MSDDNSIINVDILMEQIASIPTGQSCVICISGLSGSGKTTLAKRLTSIFAPRAVQVSEDDFVIASTKERKAFLTDALAINDMSRLRYLANPSDKKDNPFANPLSWYDWTLLRACLVALTSGQGFSKQGGWDQKTGECDRYIQYFPPKDAGVLCLVDSNYPLEFREHIDILVMLEVSPKIAQERQAMRDQHRSDHAYLAYKKMVDEIYCMPYMERVKEQANYIIPTTE